jgi:hypothetical protein
MDLGEMKENKKHMNLDEIGKENPFKVPDGYFDSFSSRLMEQIDVPAPSTKYSILWRYLRPSLSLAASIVMIFLMLFVPYKIMNKNTVQDQSGTQLISEFEYLTYFNERSIYEIVGEDETTSSQIDDATIETVLTASVSELELLEHQ